MLRLLPRGVCVFALVAGFAVAGDRGDAHSGGVPAGPDSGVKIPGVTHGQMAVIDRFSPQITDLAARAFAPDEDFRRILNYARIQQTYCAWGLMPGSVSDESSPFNACSHAYLAALQDLLVRMAEMPQPDPGVAALVRAVDGAMMADGTGLILCAYSADTFNTAQILKPDWRVVPSHLTSLVAVLGAVLAAGGMALLAARVLRRTEPSA